VTPLRRLFVMIATLAACVASAPARAQGGLQSAPSSVLADVEKRGALACGVTADAPGFADKDETGVWHGFDVDFCRALAAAIFDDPTKLRISALTQKERASALQSGWVDVLARGAPWTQARDTGQRLLYAASAFFDGQSVLTQKKRVAAKVEDLAGLTICVQQGTSFELDLADVLRTRHIEYAAKTFVTLDDAAKAYAKGLCEALTADFSTLHIERAKLAAPGDHTLLGEFISKALTGPVVRQGDDQWFNIVRWTHFAMVDAEELGVSSTSADEALKSENPQIRRLLGVDGDHGEGLGLSADWAYRIVKHVGNYGEVFERNLGQGSRLLMERRQNALWSKGGLLTAPPVR
jgi:general L-amino acid transport system substrate-binding protein